MIPAEQTWGSFIDWVSSFSNRRIVDEINILANIIDSDIAKDSILFDHVTSLYDALRDECVKRMCEMVA